MDKPQKIPIYLSSLPYN